jgi:hypothetical protein
MAETCPATLHLKSNLDWGDEIHALVRKCENPIKIVNCMKRMKYTWWGANPVILTRLSNAHIRSRMEHETFLFHKLKKKQLQRVEKQYRATRGALGYRSKYPDQYNGSRSQRNPNLL